MISKNCAIYSYIMHIYAYIMHIFSFVEILIELREQIAEKINIVYSRHLLHLAVCEISLHSVI